MQRQEAHLAVEIDVEDRSEEHTSELQSLMRLSYAVFCLKKKKKEKRNRNYTNIDNKTVNESLQTKRHIDRNNNCRKIAETNKILESENQQVSYEHSVLHMNTQVHKSIVNR